MKNVFVLCNRYHYPTWSLRKYRIDKFINSDNVHLFCLDNARINECLVPKIKWYFFHQHLTVLR